MVPTLPTWDKTVTWASNSVNDISNSIVKLQMEKQRLSAKSFRLYNIYRHLT